MSKRRLIMWLKPAAAVAVTLMPERKGEGHIGHMALPSLTLLPYNARMMF